MSFFTSVKMFDTGNFLNITEARSPMVDVICIFNSNKKAKKNCWFQVEKAFKYLFITLASNVP